MKFFVIFSMKRLWLILFVISSVWGQKELIGDWRNETDNIIITIKIYKTGGRQFIEREHTFKESFENLAPMVQRSLKLQYINELFGTKVLHNPWFGESYYETENIENGKTVTKKNEVILMDSKTILVGGSKYREPYLFEKLGLEINNK